MRRLVRHGLVGVAAATFAVTASVTALGAPISTVAVPDPAPAQPAPADPAAQAAQAQRAATARRENREAERVRMTSDASRAAIARASDLRAQGKAVDASSNEIKAARAKAAADAAAKAAKAKADKARAAAEAARARAAQQRAAKAAAAARVARAKAAAQQKAQQERDTANAQGYRPGTTDVHSMARQILANKFGYGADEFSCFSWIIDRESNWDVLAENASSGAYGLPQSLPGDKMASVAPDWRTNPATQIIWGAGYMKDRYGSPCAAKTHWESAGNY